VAKGVSRRAPTEAGSTADSLTRSSIPTGRAKPHPEETELDDVEELYLFRRMNGRDGGIGAQRRGPKLWDWITDEEVKARVGSPLPRDLPG